MDTILIIDGLNFIYRGKVKFANPDTTALDFTLVYNFFRALRSLVEQFKPDKVFFCREGTGTNFRYQISSDYKANRSHRLIKQGVIEKNPANDEDFYRQVKIIYDLLQYLPLTIASAENVEGDDIMFSLADNLRTEKVIIVSNDNDLIQVLQQGYTDTHLYNPIKKVWVSAPPYLHWAYKVLAGDKTDNVPRLTTPRKAAQLAADPQKLGVFLSVEENRANFNINRALIQLRRVPDDQLVLEEYQANFEVLRLHFKQMKFQSMLDREYWVRFQETFRSLTL